MLLRLFLDVLFIDLSSTGDVSTHLINPLPPQQQKLLQHAGTKRLEDARCGRRSRTKVAQEPDGRRRIKGVKVLPLLLPLDLRTSKFN